MTREEAITILQEKYDYCKSFYDLAAHPEEDYPEMAKYLQALQIALSALRHVSREQVDRRIGTLTQPNEGVKDKNVPTNGPLTLEELRLMVEPTPVWWDWVQGWVLARKGMIISWNGVYYNFEEVKGNFYRRPPEGEEKYDA